MSLRIASRSSSDTSIIWNPDTQRFLSTPSLIRHLQTAASLIAVPPLNSLDCTVKVFFSPISDSIPLVRNPITERSVTRPLFEGFSTSSIVAGSRRYVLGNRRVCVRLAGSSKNPPRSRSSPRRSIPDSASFSKTLSSCSTESPYLDINSKSEALARMSERISLALILVLGDIVTPLPMEGPAPTRIGRSKILRQTFQSSSRTALPISTNASLT